MSVEDSMLLGVPIDPPVQTTLGTGVRKYFVTLATPLLVSVAISSPRQVQTTVTTFFPDPVLGTLDQIEGAADRLHRFVNEDYPR